MILLLAAVPLMLHAAPYSVAKTVVDSVEVVRLADAAHQTEVWVVPSLGNNAFDMTVRGRKVLWSPYASIAELKTKPVQLGNPFLAPWANRIDQEAFYANGRKYLLNPELKNYRHDANGLPIHGLLVFAEWTIARMEAGDDGAELTSRIEFWKHPEWMAQFPFAHTIEMTYRLRDGVLQVETVLRNHAVEPMPVSVGYHTYYRLGSPRDTWKVHVPARDRVELSARLVPTGERKPVGLPDPLPLAGTQLDDVFTNLVRDREGRAEFSVEAGGEKTSVLFGPKYIVGVVWAPPGRNFICFEPMSGVTNAFNLSHTGLYKELQSVPPGGEWRESFWIRAQDGNR